MKDEPKIIDTGLEWDDDELTEREDTDMIVIHHTGGTDIDASAQQIHEWHLNQDWVGIGYHFVIRKNGTIERGRPEWSVGSHAYGENWHTLGIHLSGAMDKVQPTKEQIESCAHLVAYLCDEYEIPIDREHIVGHREVNDDTSCPGENLFAKMGEIVSKAAWYAAQDEQKGEAWREDMENIKEEITRYNTVSEIPEWAKQTVEKMIEKKLLTGGGKKDEDGRPADLDLSKDMLRVFVIHDRAGLYD